MWVKICGNTTLEDAARAVNAGADAVGFVFAPSPRRVTAVQAAAITQYLPPEVERVGVFDGQSAGEIAGIVRVAGLTAVQLHGELDEGLIEAVAERFDGDVSLTQALHWKVGDSGSVGRLAGEMWRLAELVAERGMVHRVLIDSKVGPVSGGTGTSFDWARAREVLAAVPSGVRIIVAGGLRPGNVAEAIAQLRPWGVDVASGVEGPGRKDPERMAQFIENARGAKKP
jgi:phosphoribosylanthranilate isomerase